MSSTRRHSDSLLIDLGVDAFEVTRDEVSNTYVLEARKGKGRVEVRVRVHLEHVHAAKVARFLLGLDDPDMVAILQAAVDDAPASSSVPLSVEDRLTRPVQK